MVRRFFWVLKIFDSWFLTRVLQHVGKKWVFSITAATVIMQ